MPTEAQQPDPVARIFGDGGNSSHPELLDTEARHKESQAVEPKERKPASERPARTAAPAVEELPVETAGDHAAPAEAGNETEAAEASSTTEGDEPSIPDDLTKLIAKFSDKPIEVWAGAVKGLQRNVNRTEAENKSLNEKLDRALAFITEHADEGPDGNFALRADVAARALAQRRGNGQQLQEAAVPDEAEIRQEVERQEREYLAATIDEQYIDDALKQPHVKARIEKAVKGELEHASAKYAQTQHQVALAIGQAVSEHLQAHPEDKEHFPEINALYGSIPEDVRPRAILENWMGGLPEVAHLLRLKRAFPTELKKAYQMGLAEGRKHEEPQAAGAPGAGPRRNRSTRGSDDEGYAQDYVNRIVKSGNRAGVGSLGR